ncbi:Mitochondrial Carrier (MC) Family [Phytophthora infestans T30-4]|uniref:Mitochondrial Carrier (MC) Family n=1 Tax=Phytophthora infestans (strain T30-4) TaxID=403677 RepID=D0N302_PHYIT|nr:Mitochondrial Carrier (MC) Family [Phytophthora infestans T30-4]EEY69294.1 Mitochondrial Carrier (MC) Family [Phytophthora infestans T30-4]|eukprot:XP_002999148.1 Mitochondrial Carrier (MC) Family [Phytophthora infestans T30-4]
MASESVSAAPVRAMPAPVNVKLSEPITAAAVTQPPAAATSVRVPSSSFTYRHFMGGAVGGMTAALITSPLEVVKTRLQIRGGSGSFGTQTTFGVMRSIGRTESIYGLWRGITPTLVGVIPARAIYFGSYSTFKERFANNGLNGRLYNFLSAAGAGSLSATLCCPIWVVKTRLQLMPAHALTGSTTRRNVLSVGFAEVETSVASKARPQFSSVRQVALDMYWKEGPRAFFRGLSASYWGISESAIQFALYEECKDHIEEPSNLKYFLTAGACKLLASMCTYPHEVVRTRMRDQRAPLDSKELKYKSMIQSIIKIYKEEGRRGLYSGMPAHLMRVVPNAAILFMVVEVVANTK